MWNPVSPVLSRAHAPARLVHQRLFLASFPLLTLSSKRVLPTSISPSQSPFSCGCCSFGPVSSFPIHVFPLPPSWTPQEGGRVSMFSALSPEPGIEVVQEDSYVNQCLLKNEQLSSWEEPYIFQLLLQNCRSSLGNICGQSDDKSLSHVSHSCCTEWWT